MQLPDFPVLEAKLNITFNDKDLLQQAFTHRSFINENKSAKDHNERLEFLGDAVLELAATAYLFKKYPNRNEGELTSFRAALVNTNTLSEVASGIGFNDFLLLSKGESKDTGRARQYILADTFEAVIGAVYLDQGYDAANRFIETYLLSLTDGIVENGTFIDAKSAFQEKSQESLSITPVYETTHEEGPDHNKYFTVAVKIGDEVVATGKGKSKQEAEQEAARKALEKKGWMPSI
jgi:ribonuclease-3